LTALQNAYKHTTTRTPYTDPARVVTNTETDSSPVRAGEVQVRQHSPYWFITTQYMQTSSMPSSSWNVRDKRRQVIVLSFFVNRIKSFPIRMDPLETDFRLHVIPDAQHFLESRPHYQVFFSCSITRCQNHVRQKRGLNSNYNFSLKISFPSKGISTSSFS